MIVIKVLIIFVFFLSIAKLTIIKILLVFILFLISEENIFSPNHYIFIIART